MEKFNRIFIVFALMSVSAATAYSQNCNSYLQLATEMVGQKEYCKAKQYYLQYSKCDADADVSTEIAMCERYIKLQGVDCPDKAPVSSSGYGSNSGSVNERRREDNYTSSTGNNRSSNDRQTSSRPSASRSSSQGFSGFQLHAGLLMPQGDFGEMYKTGFNLGFKLYNPMSSTAGLSWFLGLDAFYIGTKDEFVLSLMPLMKTSDDDPKPFYLNLPITFGLNYAYPINNQFSIYGEAAGGFNISKILGTKYSMDLFGNDVSVKYNYDIGTGFTFGLEAGVLLSGKYTIGIKYYNLGSYKYKGKIITEADGDKDEEKFELKAWNKIKSKGISLTVGILF